MIRTSASFESNNKKLNMLYERAQEVMQGSLKAFGERRILTETPESNTISLDFGVLGAQTLASYDFSAALDSAMTFFVSRREDGRLAASVTASGGRIYSKYDRLTGFCFMAEALELFYLSKKKEVGYLEQLYKILVAFDDYLWKNHDLNGNGCLVILNAEESGRDNAHRQFAAVQVRENQTASPFPVEAYDLMAEAYAVRMALSECAGLLGNGEEKLWAEKAEAVKSILKNHLWSDVDGICFDRDYRNCIMQSPTVNCLSLLYYGVADEDMAKRLMEEHFLHPSEFWCEMPLPSVALNSLWLKKEEELGFTNTSHSLIYRRAIHAFENYGYYGALTKLGKRFLAALEACDSFPRCFDPQSGAPIVGSAKENYMPAASAALEFIKRFWGVSVDKETVCFGTMGHEEGVSSEYRFVWGGDEYTVRADEETTSAFISGKHLFTVTGGTRVFTDIYGMSPRVVNVTDKPMDCVFVHRNHTYSFTLAPDEVWSGATPMKKEK